MIHILLTFIAQAHAEKLAATHRPDVLYELANRAVKRRYLRSENLDETTLGKVDAGYLARGPKNQVVPVSLPRLYRAPPQPTVPETIGSIPERPEQTPERHRSSSGASWKYLGNHLGRVQVSMLESDGEPIRNNFAIPRESNRPSRHAQGRRVKSGEVATQQNDTRAESSHQAMGAAQSEGHRAHAEEVTTLADRSENSTRRKEFNLANSIRSFFSFRWGSNRRTQQDKEQQVQSEEVAALAYRSDNGTRDEEFNVSSFEMSKGQQSNPYVDRAVALSSKEIISQFEKNASPRVKEAAGKTIVTLLGTVGTSSSVDIVVILPMQELASLVFQMQLTGYMFKDAEYRLSLSDSLQDVQEALSPETLHASPTIEGNITVDIGGTKVHVNADAYMAELRNKVQAMSEELAELKQGMRESPEKDLMTYIKTLPELESEKLQKFVNNISPEVIDAMKTSVKMIISRVAGPGAVIESSTPALVKFKYFMYLLTGGKKLVRQSGRQLGTICLSQLAVGYNLREMEYLQQNAFGDWSRLDQNLKNQSVM